MPIDVVAIDFDELEARVVLKGHVWEGGRDEHRIYEDGAKKIREGISHKNESAVAPMTRIRYVLSGSTVTTSVWQPDLHAFTAGSHSPYALPLTVSAWGSFVHWNGAASSPEDRL